jgi:hypothetical protein
MEYIKVELLSSISQKLFSLKLLDSTCILTWHISHLHLNVITLKDTANANCSLSCWYCKYSVDFNVVLFVRFVLV